MKLCTLLACPLARLRIRYLALLAVLLSTVVVLLFGFIPTAHAATGDFTVSAPGGIDGAVYLVRGGLTTCDSSNNCTGGLTQPKLVTTQGYSSPPSFIWNNTTIVVSAGDPDTGFRGTVNFQLSNLPQGVTSQTAPSTTITDNTILYYDFGSPVYGTDTTLQLSADTTAPLGNFTLTVTATSGSLSHSATLTVDVVDQLPATTLYQLTLPPTTSLSPSTYGGSPAPGTVQLTFPAPAGGTVVGLGSANPSVASPPASFTLPAGSTSGTFTITTQPVTTDTNVAFSATLNGQTINSLTQLLVQPPPSLASVTPNPSSIVVPLFGNYNSGASVTLTEPVPTDSNGAVVALSSSNTQAVTVPATVTVPASTCNSTGCTMNKSVGFFMTIIDKAPPQVVTISATIGSQTVTAQMTLLDSISVTSPYPTWSKSKHLLSVSAITNDPSDKLQVFVSGTTTLIGTMTNLGGGNYQGQFKWPTNPGYIDIRSSNGGFTYSPVTQV
jgi:hypothetical protein